MIYFSFQVNYSFNVTLVERFIDRSLSGNQNRSVSFHDAHELAIFT